MQRKSFSYEGKPQKIIANQFTPNVDCPKWNIILHTFLPSEFFPRSNFPNQICPVSISIFHQCSIREQFIYLKHKACWLTYKQCPVVNLIKHFTIIIYATRVVWLENCPYYNTRVAIYARKMFIRLATEQWLCQSWQSGCYLLLFSILNIMFCKLLKG